MSKLKSLQGSLVALITPFDSDEAIDYKALEGLLKWHLASGTDGLVVCGTTGEAQTLDSEELHSLVEFCVKKVDGKIPVIAGASAIATSDTIKNARICESAGADALLIANPAYVKPTDDGHYQHFTAVASAVKLPIILYNVPGRTAKNISTSVVLRLAKEDKQFMAVKEASGDLNQVMDVIRGRPEGFKVYSGEDHLAALIVLAGGDGCISVAANEIPEEFSRLLHAALEGDIEKTKILQYKYLDLLRANFIESNPIPVKTALAAMGKIQEEFRLPMCPMESQNKQKLIDVLKQVSLI